MCLFATVASSMAGVIPIEKRGLLGLEASNQQLPTVGTTHALPLIEQHSHLTQAPLSQSAPFAQESRITSKHTHTHTVERVNVPVPYAVDRTVIKHVPVDRLIPQVYNSFSLH